MDDTEFNLADLFECVADEVPGREALSAATTRRSFAELDERATRLAHGLEALGVAAGEHVGIFGYNSVEFVEAMLAAYKLRAVPLNINFRYGGGELAYLLDNGDVTTLVFDRVLTDQVASLPARPPALRSLVLVEDGSGGGEPPFDCRPYEDLVQTGSPARDFGPRSADDHYVLYTGGTTGLPRGVVWRQEDIFFATLGGGNPGGRPVTHPEEIRRTVHANRGQRATPFLPPGDPGPDEFVTLALGPLMHASGQWAVLGSLLAGGRAVLYPERSMDMELVLDLIERERVTMLTLVGDASGRPLLEALRRDGGAHDTSSLLLLGSGGSILTGEIKDGLLALLPSVLAISEAVGSSEAPVQAVAIGQRGPVPSASLRFAPKQGATVVVDDDLRPVEPGSGAVGRLATTGPVPIGYYNDPVKTAETFVEIDGRRWSLPGDMATVDADGTIRLLGRGSLCINTGGEKVYPEEVEAVLKSHPLVADAVVVGEPSERWGQQVAAVVQAADASEPPTPEDLAAHCRDHLAGYKVPRHVVLVPQVQRSASGKADYRWAGSVVGGDGPAVGTTARPGGEHGTRVAPTEGYGHRHAPHGRHRRRRRGGRPASGPRCPR
ncbi:MAG TPA: AMP-binding protein [Acidimicrobiales bacterium]|nr:AMP-binding protein [Acidimicrobiales bacterium]